MEKITLIKHDLNWEKKFEKEKKLLRDTVGRISIHHIGSTSVPDLLAKPIIDICTEASEFPPSQMIIEKLSAIGYEYNGESGIKGRIWFTKGHPRQFHLHYCSIDSEIARRQLKFRDRLRQNEALRREYEMIKLNNAFGKDVDSTEYALSKTIFIEKVITD